MTLTEARRVAPATVAEPTTPVCRVAVLTTSYPRHAQDFAGRFVMDAVAELERRGLSVEVVHPGRSRRFRVDFDGAGFVSNLRRRPWLAPLLYLSLLRMLRRAARDADLVHVHWLAGAAVARFAGKPFVVTLHGTPSAGRFNDLRLMERHPLLVRLLLRKAKVVIGVSELLADGARRCGVRDARFIPNGVALPAEPGVEADPPEVLYVGRLAPEKGIAELVEATRGMNLVAAGDGPLRELLPATLGFVPHDELERLYASAALLVCASYGEGMPLCVIEAMAHGLPVVATSVGGIPQLVEDGRTGFLVEPGDPAALRDRIERLLADAELRSRFGRAGRQKIALLCSWPAVTAQTLAAYGAALGASHEDEPADAQVYAGVGLAQTTIPSPQ
jgi:glycosyltransferase involved in cell wall biosynthesis